MTTGESEFIDRNIDNDTMIISTICCLLHTNFNHTLQPNTGMPISAQEWRVRTGMHNASKRVWLNTQRNTRYPNHGTNKSAANEALLNSPGVWSVTLTTMIAPFLPRVYTILIYTIKMLITGGGGAEHTMGSFRLTNFNNTGYNLREPNFSWINIDLQQLPGVQWLPQARGVIAIVYIATLVLCSIALLLTRHKKVQRKITISYEQVTACDIQRLNMDRVLKHTSAFNGVAVVSLGLVSLTSIVISLLLIMAGDVETNPGPQTTGATGDYNFAHKTLVDCGEKIVHGLSMDPKQIATSLHSKGFIADSTHEKIHTLPQTDTDKAGYLYTEILSTVKEYPKKYEEFIQLLEMNKRLHSGLLKVLQETHQRNSTQKPQDAVPASVLQYAEYLKQLYMEEPILQDDPWPPSLGQHYINLALIEHEEREHTPRVLQEDLLRGNIDRIQANKKPINITEIFTEKSKPLSSFRVLMDGAPGVGKTTLCRKICQDWAKGEILQECCLLVYVPLRDQEMAKAQDIKAFFHHDEPEILESVIKHVKKTKGDRVCFIFDGFDELSKMQRERKSLFLDIFKRKALRQCSAVVSSRPYASGRIQRMANVTGHRHIEVLGFNIKQIGECIMSAIPEKEIAYSLMEQLNSRPELYSLCYIPLNCAILIYVYTEEDYNLPPTITELFSLFIDNTLQRQTDIHDFSKANNQQHLHTLSKLAFDSLLKEKLTFDSEEVPEHEATLGLMTATKSFSSSGMAITYQFIHLTIQEYLAAKWISTQLTEEEQATFLQKKLLDDRFRMVLIFFSGITKLKGQMLQEVLSTQMHFDNCLIQRRMGRHIMTKFFMMTHLAYESLNPKACYAVAASVEGKVLVVNDVLSFLPVSEFELNTLGYLIAQSGCTWEMIDLCESFTPSMFTKHMKTPQAGTKIKRLVIRCVNMTRSIVEVLRVLFSKTSVTMHLEYLEMKYNKDKWRMYRIIQEPLPPLTDQYLPELHLKEMHLKFSPQTDEQETLLAEDITAIVRKCKSLEYLEITTFDGWQQTFNESNFAEILNEIELSSIKHVRMSVSVSQCLSDTQQWLHSKEDASTLYNPIEALLLNKADLCSLRLTHSVVFDKYVGKPPEENKILRALMTSKLKQLSIATSLIDTQNPQQFSTMLSANNTLQSLTLRIGRGNQNLILKDLVLGLKRNKTLKKLVVDGSEYYIDIKFIPLLCQTLKTQPSLEVLVIHTQMLCITPCWDNIPILLLYNSALSVVRIFAHFTQSQLKRTARCLVLNGKRRSIELDFDIIPMINYETTENDILIQDEVNLFKSILFTAMIKLLAHLLTTRKRQQCIFLHLYNT